MDFGNFLSGGLAAPSTAISGTSGNQTTSFSAFATGPRIVCGLTVQQIAIIGAAAFVGLLILKKA